MKRDSKKDLYQGKDEKGRYPLAFLRRMGHRSGLHAETGCMKVLLGKYLSDNFCFGIRRRRLGMVVA